METMDIEIADGARAADTRADGAPAEGTPVGDAAERMVPVAAGIDLCCRVDGEEGAPPVVLVAGLGQQLIEWPPELVDGLLAAGFRVVRFDNRDVGRSGRAPVPAPTAKEMLTRRFAAHQYVLGDLALDTVGLLDELGIDSAHLVGMSMGGMIAQTVAARHPSRVRSLTSIMSTTGAKRLGRPTLGTYLRLFRPVSPDRGRAAEATVAMMRHIGARGYAFDADRVRATALAAWDRDGGPNPDGPARQLGAIFKSGDRTREVAQIVAPTLVVHGDRDPMIAPTGGWATARAIPRARLLTIQGMGHDLPAEACPELVEAIAEHVQATERRRETADA